MTRRQCPGIATLACAIILVSGCAGKQIRDTYRADHEAPPPRTVSQPTPVEGPPYHLTLTLGPQFIETTLANAFSRALLEQDLKDAVRREIDATVNETFQAIGRRGPLARRIVGRIAAARERLGGTQVPDLRLQAVTAHPSPECDACMDVRASLVPADAQPGGPPPPVGRVSLLVELQATPGEKGIRVEAAVKRILDLRIDLPGLLPGLTLALGTVMERVQARIDAQVAAGAYSMAHEIPLPALEQEVGPFSTVASARVHVLPAPPRPKETDSTAAAEVPPQEPPEPPGVAMVLGVNLDLSAAPTIGLDSGPPPRGEAWRVTIGAPVIQALMLEGVRNGRIPTRFTRKGLPSEDGPYALDLEELHVVEGGFEISARMWHLAWPVWTRQYALAGTLTMENGRPTPRLTTVTPGDGEGCLLFSSTAGRKILSSNALDRLAASISRAENEGQEFQNHLQITSVEAIDGAVVVSGTLR